MNKAKQHGAGIVTVRRAGHTGRLADYMEMATEAGLIGMGAVCTGSSVTTLYGGMEPITGTNPIAFGIPARNGQRDHPRSGRGIDQHGRNRTADSDRSTRHARRSRQSDHRFQDFSRPAARRVLTLRRP